VILSRRRKLDRERLEQRLDQIGEDLAGMEQAIQSYSQRLGEMEDRLERIEAALAGQGLRVD
jgi:archaellum component FlaC